MNAAPVRDVMQICRSGHVVTDRLHGHPELGRSRCPRCGSATISRCPSCGRDLPGALRQPGPTTIGEPRPPDHCPSCGSAFPWTRQPTPASLTPLEPLLRRLPAFARQLRDRHERRPTLLVGDTHDLQDLLRAVLHLHYDNVRPETRTPRYTTGTRTDFILASMQLAITAKLIVPGVTESQIAEQLREDIAYYEQRGGCACLVCLLYDAGQLLPKSIQLETRLQQGSGGIEVRCLVANGKEP